MYVVEQIIQQITMNGKGGAIKEMSELRMMQVKVQVRNRAGKWSNYLTYDCGETDISQFMNNLYSFMKQQIQENIIQVEKIKNGES